MIPHLILITGATATGKTRLAVDLADKYNLEIISADSRQVYRGLDIGTGKDLETYQRGPRKIPYHLIDVSDPEEIYNLFRYQRECYQVIQDLSEKEHPVVLMVGGSGLYLEAVIKKYHLSSVPEHPEFRNGLLNKTREDLDRQLKEKSPVLYKQTDNTSKKRLIRALEIVEFTDPYQFQTITYPEFTYEVFCLNPPRQDCYNNISRRLEERLNQGMIEEVQGLLKAGVTPERMNMLGLEYRIISQYLLSEQSLAEMKEKLAMEIRRMAKQQITWFRGFEKRGVKTQWIEKASLGFIEPSIIKHLPQN